MIITIVVVEKHRNFVVQAGVIPKGEGIMEQPSSTLAPGVRYVTTSLEDNSKKVQQSSESAFAESEAPIGVPMSMTSQTVTPSTVQSSTVTPIAPISPINPNIGTTIASSSSSSATGSSFSAKIADIMKAAEASLADANGSISEMRRQQVAILKQEADVLSRKARELQQEAQALIDEANTLDDSNTKDSKQQ